MPDIYKYFGYVFSFYTNEHEPIHVHAKHDGRETMLDLIIVNKELVDIRRRDKGKPLTSKEEKVAREFVKKYWKGIVEKWVNLFVYNARIRCTEIKTKL